MPYLPLFYPVHHLPQVFEPQDLSVQYPRPPTWLFIMVMLCAHVYLWGVYLNRPICKPITHFTEIDGVYPNSILNEIIFGQYFTTNIKHNNVLAHERIERKVDFIKKSVWCSNSPETYLFVRYFSVMLFELIWRTQGTRKFAKWVHGLLP